MSILQALILGIVQGVSEFLPISSSGHLVVMREIMRVGEIPLLFDVLLHVATLVVVVFVFRQRIWSILKSLGRVVARRAGESDAENLRLSWVLLLATALTGIVGIALNNLEVGAQPKIVSGLFILTGLILIGAHFLKPGSSYSRLGVKHAVITGIAQGLGVLPGVSRSGITISASLASGLSREKSGEYSFLLSIPAILGALMLTLNDAGELSQSVGPAALVVGIVSAFAAGLASLLVLLWLVKGGRLYLFSFYLIPAGIAGIIWL